MGQDNSKQVDSPDEWDIVAAPEEHFEHYLTHDVITKQRSLNGGEIVVDVVDKRSSRDSYGPAPSGSGDVEKARGKPTPTNGHHHHHRRRRRSLSGDSSSSGSSKEDAKADPLGVNDTRSSSKHQQQQQQVMQGEGDGDKMWDGIPAGKFEDDHALNQYQSTIMHEVKVNYDVRNSRQHDDEGHGDYDYTSTDPFIALKSGQLCQGRCNQRVKTVSSSSTTANQSPRDVIACRGRLNSPMKGSSESHVISWRQPLEEVVRPSVSFDSLRAVFERKVKDEQTCQACHKPVADMDKLFVDTTVYHKQCFRWEDEVQEEMELDDPNIASQNPHPAAEDELIQWGDDADMPASSANHHRISSTSSASLQLQRHSSQLETDSNERHTASFEFTVGQGREVTNDKEQSDQPAVRQRSEVAFSMASSSASIQLHNQQSVAPTPVPPVSTESYTYEDEDDGYNNGRSDNREEGGKNRQGQGYPRIELGEGRISENEPIVRGDVIRETDQLSDPTPPSKMARNMADKFETMTTSFRRAESQRQPLPAKKDFKWNVRELGLKKPTIASQVDSNASPASGWEDNNYGQGRSQAGPGEGSKYAGDHDLVEATTDLPPANLTRSLLSKFQNQTAETRHLPPPSPARTQQQVKVAAVGSRTRFSRGVSQTSSMSSLANSSAAGSNERIDGVMETSLNLDYEDDIQERHLYFGEPTEDADTAAASSRSRQQQEVVSEVPEQGTTRNLLAKFQSMQNSTRKK